jgi:hypothetical protein
MASCSIVIKMVFLRGLCNGLFKCEVVLLFYMKFGPKLILVLVFHGVVIVW